MKSIPINENKIDEKKKKKNGRKYNPYKPFHHFNSVDTKKRKEIKSFLITSKERNEKQNKIVESRRFGLLFTS